MAVGCVGMSLRDFDRCTPFEFTAIMTQWNKCRESEVRLSWEQTRFLAVTQLQPYSKKALRPEDVVTFPWEKKKGPAVMRGTSSRERMEKVAARLKQKL